MDSQDAVPEFRPAFVESIVQFFGEEFDSLSRNERAHAIGVVANTLAALSVNLTKSANPESMATTLGVLNTSTNETVENFVCDESTALLFPQSRGLCETIRQAIAIRSY